MLQELNTVYSISSSQPWLEAKVATEHRQLLTQGQFWPQKYVDLTYNNRL